MKKALRGDAKTVRWL